jgi:RNA polymerase sigma-70 factor, ECF subfamily
VTLGSQPPLAVGFPDNRERLFRTQKFFAMRQPFGRPERLRLYRLVASWLAWRNLGDVCVNRREERRLLERIKGGDRSACEELVCAHYEAIFRFLAYMVRDVDFAGDLTQETFASAWARITDFEGRSALRTWLHRIAYGTLADARRKRRRTMMLAAAGNHAREESTDASPLDAVLATERTSRVNDAVTALPDEADRMVIVLHYYQGLTFREAASVLGEPTGTVKWRTSRAIERLRQILQEKARDETEPNASWK